MANREKLRIKSALKRAKQNTKRNALKRFGEKLGIAFQIKDDLFDIVGKIDKVHEDGNIDLIISDDVIVKIVKSTIQSLVNNINTKK